MTTHRAYTRLRLITAIALSAVGACTSHNGSTSASTASTQILSSTHANTTDEMTGRRFPPLRLSGPSPATPYGYSPETAIKVGGGFGEGSHRTYGFLNALTGPRGEPVHYFRIGTCCEFKTPNSPFDGAALLEVYDVTVEGSSTARRLYFNWYDSGDLWAPSGFTSKP